MYYPATFIPDADGRYSVLFADLPGCLTSGENLDHALHMASEALGVHVGGMLQDGETPPPPSTLKAAMECYRNGSNAFGLACHPEAIHQFVHFKPHLLACPVEAPIALHITRELSDLIDEIGEKLGLSRPDVVEAAVRAFLSTAQPDC